MILMLYKDFSGKITENLFIEPYDEVMAKWVGGRMRAAEATDISGVESIKDISTFEDSLNTIIERSRGLGKFHIYLDLWRYNKDQADSPAQILAKHVQKFYPAVEIDELYGDMAALRAIKSEEEIAQMRKAQEATRIAIEAMMKHAYPGINESELEGAFDFALMKQCVRDHAFPSIVAGGGRATTLHYSSNNSIVEDGQVVLIDLGAAVGNYCADISRTFPVNGKFTERQKEIYNTVLNVQQLLKLLQLVILFTYYILMSVHLFLKALFLNIGHLLFLQCLTSLTHKLLFLQHLVEQPENSMKLSIVH